MKRPLRALGIAAVGLILAIATIAGPAANAAHVTTVPLGTAGNFAVLAGTPNITNVPASIITGDVGLSPGPGSGIAVTCADMASGTIYATDGTKAVQGACDQVDAGLLTTAKNALVAAYDNASPPARPGGTPIGQLGTVAGQTLFHGVYADDNAPDSMNVANRLILDAQGDTNAVWVFQSGSTLTTMAGSSIELVNGAQACNVFWQVTSSATLGVNSTFVGTILALTSIVAQNGATINGRLLARNGNVTLDRNTITRSTCSAPAVFVTTQPTMTPTPSPSPTPSASPSATPAPVATATPGPVATPVVTVAPAAGTPRTGSGITGLPSTSTDDLEVLPTWALVLALAAFAPLILVMRARERRAKTVPKS